MTFAEKLRALMKEAGKSEAGLAADSGVSFGAVHSYCLGDRSPTFVAVVRLARALGVTCEAFAACDDIANADSLRGKPAKGSASAQGERSTGQGAGKSSGQRRPATSPRRKLKG